MSAGLRFGSLAILLLACGNDSGAASTSPGHTGAGSSVTSSGDTSSSSGSGSGGSGGSGGGACHTCAEPVEAFVPAELALTEVSGLAASAVHEGVLYAHNDSGDTARFFAIGASGEARGTYVLQGAAAIDWEDMARGPCADTTKSCLYLADVGDNPENRSSYTIYRVAEPAVLAPGEHVVTFEALPFVYPDGSHNCETLLVHPITGQITIVTKDGSTTAAYDMPLPVQPGTMVTLGAAQPVEVGGLVKLVTGGDIHPQGDAVLLRTYLGAWRYPIGRGETAAQALARSPCAVPVAGRMQGETIAWSSTGDAYLTMSEGAGSSVFRAACR